MNANNNHNNRNRNRRRNRRRVENPAGDENRPGALAPAAGRRVENEGRVDLENRAPAPADIRHLEGWGYVDFENRALARPALEADYDVARIDQSISAEGEADTIRPLIALAVRQMGPSCLFWVSAGPIQAANGQMWDSDHHVKAHGDQALAKMTVALAVHKWGQRAQISMTARPPPPAPQPQQQMAYSAPPAAPHAAPYGEYYQPPHHYPAPPAPAPYQP
ncbi:hypothetical protein N0V85_003637 [Neurospora sp. IMI 360204]|nr:hypothetical protein N0V85_003637 [Neurospora sp. IMI 360204]